MKCPATKQVQQKDTTDPPLFSVTYFNHHTCITSSNPKGCTRDIAAQSSSRKAVSICFSPHTASEQPTFLTSSAMPQSPNVHSFRANQQPERSPYASQFQWTDTSCPVSNSQVQMEVDSFSAASTASSSSGALPRTLLPIGQSRCIEYFHFLWCWSWKKMLLGRLVSVWSVKRSEAWTTGTNLQTDPHIDITALLFTSLHSYSSHVFVLEWCGEWYFIW
jgi:hypothetical protein